MAKRNGGIIGPSNVPTGQYGGTASGVWRLRDAFNYIKAGLWPGSATYPVGNSLRFNSGSSDSLTRTPATTGTSRRIMTFSFWTKRSGFETTNAYRLFSTFYGGGASQFWIRFADSGEGINKISIASYDSGFSLNLITTQVFRDPSAWYHFVISFDTTQGTSSNRVKMYVNGEQVTSFSTATYPSQNYDLQWNVTEANQIGGNAVSANEFYNGYFSEINFIDGQQLTPSSFGQTDSATGIWTPLPYTGTYGTNGFFLKFANSAALGTDSSGNGNNFTVNNLTSIDQTTDTPTNNFATLNPLMYDPLNIATMTDGNLTALSTTGSFALCPSTLAVGGSSKWYYEVKCISGTPGDRTEKVGWGNPDKGISMNAQGSIVYRNSSGNKIIDNVDTAYGATWTDGDIIGVALDIGGGTVTFYKNGTTQGNITISGGLDDGTFYIALINLANTDKTSLNFGNPPYAANGYTDAAGYGNFSYAVPAGYYSLCTKNLANFG